MSGCAIKRILQFSVAIKYQNINIYDLDNIDITTQCQYSWSIDGVCWTNWTDYSSYLKICKNIESDFYLRILLFGSLDRVYLNDSLTTCYNICLDSTNPFIQDFCENSNLFQPYNNLDCALQLQQQMADSIVCMFGIPIYYFRVQPKEESVDYTFKEWFLHDVVDVKQIKLMISDGTMPSSNPKLTEFDFDWESDWDVELSKSQFAKAFGDNAFPSNRDFIYIPMMKRMWVVNSAYDEKNEGLLWRPTTWKLALVKYNDLTNVSTKGFDDLIDGWVSQTYEETFGKIERNEQERSTSINQISSPVVASNNLYDIFMEDSIRKSYTKDDIIISSTQINNLNSIVSRNSYKFLNTNGTVIYQKGICGDSGTISFIFNSTKIDVALNKKSLLNFGTQHIDISRSNGQYKIHYNNLSSNISDNNIYIVIARWNRNTFSTELNIYKQTARTDVPEYILKPSMRYFDFENPICELTGAYNNDYILDKPLQCSICGYPVELTNIKYYDKYLDKIDVIKESIKYTTQHESCIINDLARPLNTGLGYAVK